MPKWHFSTGFGLRRLRLGLIRVCDINLPRFPCGGVDSVVQAPWIQINPNHQLKVTCFFLARAAIAHAITLRSPLHTVAALEFVQLPGQ